LVQAVIKELSLCQDFLALLWDKPTWKT